MRQNVYGDIYSQPTEVTGKLHLCLLLTDRNDMKVYKEYR